METNYTLRLAAFEEAYEIWSIMDICYQALEHKEYFICDDLEYVKDILSGNGFGVVACDHNGKIVGNLLVKYPGITDENLGYDVFIKYPGINEENPGYDVFVTSQNSKNEVMNLFFNRINNSNIQLTSDNLNRVLHMDSASVLPKHRGHGLEQKMIAFAETLVDTSKYCYSFATVAPDNTASLKSLEKNGYQVMVVKEKYEGLVRCVMMKTLK